MSALGRASMNEELLCPRCITPSLGVGSINVTQIIGGCESHSHLEVLVVITGGSRVV